MQTRLTNSFITTARLISAQTLPRARREPGTLRPPHSRCSATGRGRGAGTRGGGTRGAHAGDSRGHPVGWCQAMGRWDTLSGQGVAPCPWHTAVPCSTRGHVGALCPSSPLPGACRTSDWPGAGLRCPALASDPAGSLPGWSWHRRPAGISARCHFGTRQRGPRAWAARGAWGWHPQALLGTAGPASSTPQHPPFPRLGGRNQQQLLL